MQSINIINVCVRACVGARARACVYVCVCERERERERERDFTFGASTMMWSWRHIYIVPERVTMGPSGKPLNDSSLEGWKLP